MPHCSKWSGRPDLNRGPPAPKAGALPGCATPRQLLAIDSTALLDFPAIDLALTCTKLCKLALNLTYCAQSREFRVVEKQEVFLTLEFSEAAHLA